MRPLRNISSKQTFSFSRNVSSTPSANNQYTHQFFNPSYIPPKDLIKLDEVGYKQNNTSNKNSNKGIFKYVAPALSVTKNYVIFDTCNNNNDNHIIINNTNITNNELSHLSHSFDDKILLRNLNYVGNKNSHINISIHSINQNHTILNIRRANSNQIKKVLVSNKVFSKRNYSTDNLNNDLSKLTLESNEKEQHKETEKIQEIHSVNEEPIQNFTSVDQALDTFAYTDPISLQEKVIDSYMKLNKYNEILPVFNRLRNNNLIPNISIYNKVLKSITLRQTDESLETQLTHLLNTYSDMLSNNLKPNNLTYEVVIESLINGSIKSYNTSNFKNGYDFFRIAMELFLINQSNQKNIFSNNTIYLNLIKCLNNYKIKDLVKSEQLFTLLNAKINDKNKPQFFIELIKFATLFKDLNLIESIYNTEIKKLNNISHDLIYQTIIESYNLCNETKKSSLMLDTIINNLPNKQSNETQLLIKDYLSIYTKSLSLVDPTTSYKMLYKFNNIEWLPSVSIDSLLVLSYSFLKLNNLNLSLKVWNFAVMRNDFDISVKNLKTDEYLIYLSIYLNLLCQSILINGDKNSILQFVRTLLLKNVLVIDDLSLINIIKYLKSQNDSKYNSMIIKLILNHGYKKLINKSDPSLSPSPSLNNYLSHIIDFIPSSEILTLFSSSLFKRIVEEYRLINDNIYGILKLFNLINVDDLSHSNLLKLKYYSKVLNYEFNDNVDNCYVQLPIEITEFKNKLVKFI